MFYSHQLLARKAPLGQIWMAATMHAKINRRKLDQIDIIRICEEILNPSVPMALRLSGILMGGVVIVYERKVRLLYDDVNRLLIEINAAWKVKPAVDPTVLPKGKAQAKFEDVTLPENQDADLGDIEQPVDYSNKHAATGFQSAYFSMRLDTIDELTESFMQNIREKVPDEHHHQADIANITLDDAFDSHQADTGPYNRFERFDIQGDEETQFDIPSQEHTQIPITPVYSPPAMQPQKDDVIAHHEEKQVDQSSAEDGETRQEQPQQGLQKRMAPRKRARRQASFFMDDEKTMIPSNLYQSWLQDSTDISARRPKIRKQVSPILTMKLIKLIELPPVALSCGLMGRDHSVYYPQQLLQLFMRSIQPPNDSPSRRATSPLPPEPSSSSPPPNGQQYQDPPEFHMGGFGTEVGSDRMASMEKLRSNPATGIEFPTHEFNLMFSGAGATDPKAQTGSSGTRSRSFLASSPDLGLDFISNTSDSYSGRLDKKRAHSSARLNGIGLESLDEENQWIHEAAEHNLPMIDEQPPRGFKIPRHSRPVPTPEEELLIETGRITQTQHPFIDEEAEMMTRHITTHLKTYFDTPGAPQTESLNQLAYGMNRKQAAQLFYQTCVLATRDVLKVQQRLAYGDITISRGAKM